MTGKGYVEMDRLMQAFRAALEVYDASVSKHPEGCPCGGCWYVRSTRELVNDYFGDDEQRKETPP